jgi:hypothetical protein
LISVVAGGREGGLISGGREREGEGGGNAGSGAGPRGVFGVFRSLKQSNSILENFGGHTFGT